MAGPLAGIRIVEIAGMGPAPFAGMVLSDMGADVVRVDRAAAARMPVDPMTALLGRNRRSVAVDLKHPEGPEVVLGLVASADALIEGFRPGVMERLGLSPETCLTRNPRLTYGRMTGWGQDGPYAAAAGHDINYIALSGALHPIGAPGSGPVPPLNLAGDFGGGGMLLAFGVVCGILEASRSGEGQVVDAAMIDGSALLMTMIHQLRAMGEWTDERGANLLDGGAPFYRAYETADGEHVSVGAIEPAFYAELVRLAGAEPLSEQDRLDKTSWPQMRERMAALFRTKTRAQWCELLEHSDACFAPVLSMPEAMGHPHMVHRGTFTAVDGVPQPAPAPRFSRTPPQISRPPAAPGEHTDEVLADWGLEATQIARLRDAGAIV